MTEAEIRDRVADFIRDTFLYMRPNVTIGADESLLRSGVIDSLGVMEIIQFVENFAQIQVSDDEITEANFGTLNAIARYIDRKRTA